MTLLLQTFRQLQTEFDLIKERDFHFTHREEHQSLVDVQRQIFLKAASHLAVADQRRLENELFGVGPLDDILIDTGLTEILIHGPKSIWVERAGKLEAWADHFFSELSFSQIMDRIYREANAHIQLERPFASGQFRNCRLSLVHACITKSYPQLSLRRHPENPWNLDQLVAANWCNSRQAEQLRELVRSRKNFLIIGTTGAGKTSVANAFLQELPINERSILIEDTPELHLPNDCSAKLLTRESSESGLPEITQSDLVRKALRLRPDRLVMGEMRGNEAKDFLMMIATGHAGCFGTLHAKNAQQALMRLEMLVQMGAPDWSLATIRRLLFQSLECIVITGKNAAGQRRFGGMFQIQSLEDYGFTVEEKISADQIVAC